MEEIGVAPVEVERPMTSLDGALGLTMLMEADPGIDAIFCASDTLAIGAIQECHRRRWPVPGRVAIAGYGDLELASQMFPAITTVRIRRHEMGQVAANMLLDIIYHGGNRHEVRDLGYEIIQRESA